MKKRPLYRSLKVTVVLCLDFAALCEAAHSGQRVQLDTTHTILDAVVIETADEILFHFPFPQVLAELAKAGYTIVAILPADRAPAYFPFWDEHELAVAQWVLEQVIKKLNGLEA